MKNRIYTGPLVLKTVIVAFVLLISVSMAIGAELYRYTDQTGAVRYTDTLSKVPADQRSNVKKIMTPSPSSEESPAVDEAPADDPPQEPDPAPKDDIRQLEFERLSQEKKMLDEEYGELMNTKEELSQKKEQIDLKTYNDQANQLNERISAYEEKREAFKKAADAFNAQLNENG